MSGSEGVGPYPGPHEQSGTLPGGQIDISADLEHRCDLVPVLGERRPRALVPHPIRQRLRLCPGIRKDRLVGVM